MNERIAVFTDKKKDIDYETILGYYKIDYVNDKVKINNHLLLIIDLEDISRIVQIANNVRDQISSIPILFIVKYPNREKINIIKNINGIGAVKILEYKIEFKSNVLLFVQSLIHPEYPGKKNDIAIIVPVFDEASRFNNIVNQTRKLKDLVENAFLNTTIYFINDGSKDETEQLINNLISKVEGEVDFIERTPILSSKNLIVNTRKAGTYIEGIKNVDAEYVFFIDGDDSFIMEDVSKMINILMDGYYDFVIGTKDKTAENRSIIRQIMSFSKRLLTKGLLPKGVKDSQTGLKGMRNVVARSIVDYMHIKNGLAADLEMLFLAKKLNFRVYELPVTCYDREGSHINIIKDSLMFLKAIREIPRQNKRIKYE